MEQTVAIACVALAWVLDRVLPDQQHQRELALINTSAEGSTKTAVPVEKSSAFDPNDARA